EANGAVEAAKGRLVEVDGELAAFKRHRAEAEQNVETAREAGTKLDGELKRVAALAEGALEGLAPEQQELSAFEAALAAAVSTHEGLQKRFDEARDAIDRGERAHDKATTALTSAEGQLATSAERLEGLEAAFNQKLLAAGFSGRDDFDDAAMPENDLEELQRELREHDEALKLNADAIRRLAKKLKGKQPPDVAVLEAAVQQAREAESTAEATWTQANGAQDRVRQALDRFHDLERKDATVAERRVAAQKLSELANGALKGRAKVNFETFVLRSIFARVLVEGNRHLKHMTAGRYSLLLIDDPSGRDTGLELNVRDNASGGETRPVHTLSGGEGFLASLALALGLSEVSQRESGGVELGALFIDEGFGSLDAQALDQVIDILRGLEEGHRMVGIISHVEDLKRRIPVQLLVLDAGAGSRVEMRLNA
ncbi:MAG TPA: SbcC/MukB-like Walker B domain-containing protein, partial [Trueperaceae bacterium]|nr:SbcC/MukB-like Walker B domain-containing protein [Trueperaceae bacterium]